MSNPILKEMTVPIPEDGSVVIRNGKRVEYQLERVYSPETKDSRVKRQAIGKVDPMQEGRMFPNEAYFELFPDNEVPEEVRDEFLRECAIKRDMEVIRRNPEEIVDQVINGLGAMNSELENRRSLDSLRALGYRPFSAENEHTGSFSGRDEPRDDTGDSRENKGVERKYTITRRVFDEIYYAIEELAGKFPNEVIDPFKVERINEVLSTLRGAFRSPPLPPSAETSPNPYGYLRLIEEGLTYSDVLLMLKWYKVLPR